MGLPWPRYSRPVLGLLAREYVSISEQTIRRMVVKTTFAQLGVLILVLYAPLLAFCADNPTDSYIRNVTQLIDRHEESIDRLAAPAESTAQALLAGGSFYLAGDPAWISEGTGRAGGLLATSPLPTAEQFKQLGEWFGKVPEGATIKKGDVVWLSYTPETFSSEAANVKDLEGKQCLVVAFGPKPPNGPPPFTHWVDSLTPWTADTNFTRMGNVLSLWTLTGEVAASTSRQNQTLAFYQSLVIYGARERNDIYTSQRPYKGSIATTYPPLASYHTGLGNGFHDGIPSMKPVQAGVLARSYLQFVSNMVRQIKDHELESIAKVGHEMLQRASESHPVYLMVLGHLMFYATARDNKMFHYLDVRSEGKNLRSSLSPDAYFIWLGYVATPLDFWYAVRSARARGVWIVSPLPAEVDFSQFDDVVINQHWLVGDAAVEVPGYDIRILPPSGIAQLFIYELLLRASGGGSS